MSLKLPLLFAVLALLFSTSTTLRIPSSLGYSIQPVPINNTNISPQAPSRQFPDIAFAPWPARPYQVAIAPRFGFPDLCILAVESYHARQPVRVQEVQDFLREFRDNIEREYPIPGYVPRLARQSIIDMETYTEWVIDINEGLFGRRLRTEWALLALDEIARQLGSHGPANLLFSIKEARSTYTYGFFTIMEFGGRTLNATLANGKTNFETS